MQLVLSISYLILKECSIELSVNPGENESVTLFPNNVMIKQSLDMVLFTITDHVLVPDPEEGIRMTITLKRKIMSEMMTTYFPSFLLMMITYCHHLLQTLLL